MLSPNERVARFAIFALHHLWRVLGLSGMFRVNLDALRDRFRPMLQRPAWFICEQCGHVVIPEDSDFKCSCHNCLKVKRAA